jgi:diguanylate cyclase (GGDEF)-like protein
MQAFIVTISSIGFLVCVTMSERRRAEAAFEHLAKHDALTGLANRRYFMERLDQATARVDRSPEGAAIAYFDLDGFKEINDRFGHLIGDAALIEVGRRLAETVRGSDVVARIGGDEFAALLEPVDGIDGAQAAARRIADAVEQPVTFGEITMPIGLSVGTALVGSSSELALTDADIELYLDKKHSHPARTAAAQR